MNFNHSQLLFRLSVLLTSALLITGVSARAFPDSIFQEPEPPEEFHHSVEKFPVFLGGGLPEFRDWVLERIVYPREALERNIEGRVVISFVIEKDGSMGEDIEVLISPDSLLTAEVIKVVRMSPDWEPGMNGDRPVRVKMTLPIVFRITPTETGIDQRFLSEDAPFLIVEQMPRFRNGDLKNFRQWVIGEIQFPPTAPRKKAAQRVIVEFIVEKDGTVGDIKILNSPHSLFSEEVIRVLSESPLWEPGYQRGRAARVKFTLPVDFKSPGKKNKGA